MKTTATTSAPSRVLRRGLTATARSVGMLVPVFLVATFVTFALRALSGLSPAHLQLGESATPESVARIEHQWGLDHPFLTQYTDWFTAVLHGDLGRSWFNGAGISELLLRGAEISLSVAGTALLIGVTFGFGLGTLAAARQGTWIDRAITGAMTFISVMPSFVVGIVLVAVFAVRLEWFPSAGYIPAERGFGVWLAHITLPAIALSFDTISDVARQLRSGLVSAYRENYVTGAVVRGLTSRQIFFRHVLRNAAGPTLTVVGMKFPNLLGGAVVTEAIFGMPGFGQFAANSAERGDVPAVQGVLVVSIVVVVVFNVLVNLLLTRVTPAAARGV